eukprot:TRINITY_DN1163_c0_g1_i1.p1 TRINITY_DN1163_c0_g1~~TRINITY_DN1163_c0_g1_i1.p1  ORF type:complete len:1381 (+),score=178.37 TRINITY_DN1163_c0_g1_i1:1779-5921(+)
MKTLHTRWPVKSLRILFKLFNGILYLPLFGLFVSMLSCDTLQDGRSVVSVEYSIECWEGVHLLYVVSAVISLVVFAGLTTMISSIYYEISSDSQNPEAKISSFADVQQIWFKTAAVLLFAFFKGPKFVWLRIGSLLIWSLVWFYNVFFKHPYLNHCISVWRYLASTIFGWTSVLLALNQLLEFSEFNGGTEGCFMTYPLVLVIVYFSQNPLEKKLLTPFKDLPDGPSCCDHIRYLLQLGALQDTKQKVSLEGYLNKFNEFEGESESLLKYTLRMSLCEAVKESQESRSKLKAKKVVNKQLIEHSLRLFKKATEKFPKCNYVKIRFAIFLLEKLQNNSCALKELAKVEKHEPSFEELFLIYRIKRGVEEKTAETSINGSELDMLSVTTYQNHKKLWEEYMLKAVQEYIKFWTHLTEDTNDLNLLAESGASINYLVSQVEEHWKKMQRCRTSPFKTVQQYATFLKQVLNDHEGSNELLRNLEEGKIPHDESYVGEETGEVEEVKKFTEEGYGVIIASGDTNIGKINAVSMGTCSLFGYSKGELIGADTEVLLPRLFTEKHKELLISAMEKPEEKCVAKERLVYARHKSGYIFTIEKQVKVLPSASNNWQFVICIRKDKKKSDLQAGIILFTKEMIIMDLSFRVVEVMKLAVEPIAHLKVKLKDLFPDIVNEEWVKDNLMADYKELPYNPPSNIKLEDIANVEGNIYKKKERCLLKLRTKKGTGEKLQCTAKEIAFSNGLIVGYALFVKKPGQTFIPMITPQQDLWQKSNKSKVEWMYVPENAAFIRVNSAGANERRFTLSSRWEGSAMSPSKNSRFNSAMDEVNKKEPTLFAKLAKQIGLKWNKPDYSEGIITKRQENGYVIKLSKKLIVKEQEAILFKEGDCEVVQEETFTTASFSKNIAFKSRKEIIKAINNGKPLPAIGNLNILSFIVLIGILSLASIEYGVFTNKYTGTLNDLNKFSIACDLPSQVVDIVYNTRNLALAQQVSPEDPVKYEEEAREKLAGLQTRVGETQKMLAELAKSHQKLDSTYIKEKAVPINFKVGELYKIKTYNLLESMLILNSHVIKLANAQTTDVLSFDESEYFVRYNGLNSIYSALQCTLNAFKDDTETSVYKSTNTLLILMLFSCFSLLIGCNLATWYLKAVLQTKEETLLLFFRIKRTYAKTFVANCQKFQSTIQKRKDEEEVESENSEDAQLEGKQGESNGLSTEENKQYISAETSLSYKRSAGKLYRIILGQLLISVAVISYFVASYMVFVHYLMNSFPVMGKAVYLLGVGNAVYGLNFVSMREVAIGNDWPIEGRSPVSETLVLTENMTRCQEQIKRFCGLSGGTIKFFFGDFNSYLSNYLKDSLCDSQKNDYFVDEKDCIEFGYSESTHVCLWRN